MSAVSLDPSFQRAFVAIGYLLGVRGAALTAALEAPAPACLELARALEVEDRQLRARTLGGELGRLARAIDHRRLA